MKKLILSILIIITAAGSTKADQAPLQFRSILSIGEERLFSVSTEGGTRIGWVSIGDQFGGYEIADFLPEETVLLVSKDGKRWRVGLRHAAPIALIEEASSASAVEGVMQAMEGLSADEKLELVMNFAVAEAASFIRRIESARSPEEAVSIIDNYRLLITIGDAVLDQIRADLPSGERLDPDIMDRIPDAQTIGARAHQLIDDLKAGNGHGSDPKVQSAIRRLEEA